MFGLSARAIVEIVGGLIVASLIGGFLLWIHNKDVQIARAQSQRNAAIAFALDGQRDLAIARVNTIVLTAGIARQNASLVEAERQAQNTAQALVRSRQEADRAAVATDRRVASIQAQEAALRARGDVCVGALALVRGR